MRVRRYVSATVLAAAVLLGLITAASAFGRTHVGFNSIAVTTQEGKASTWSPESSHKVCLTEPRGIQPWKVMFKGYATQAVKGNAYSVVFLVGGANYFNKTFHYKWKRSGKVPITLYESHFDGWYVSRAAPYSVVVSEKGKVIGKTFVKTFTVPPDPSEAFPTCTPGP
jgi:hypothetical protein